MHHSSYVAPTCVLCLLFNFLRCVRSCAQQSRFSLYFMMHDLFLVASNMYTWYNMYPHVTWYNMYPQFQPNFVSLCTMIRPLFHPACTLYPLSPYARFVPVAPIVLYRRKHAVLQFTITTHHLLLLSCMQGTRLYFADHLVIRQWVVLHTPKSLHVCALNHNARGGNIFSVWLCRLYL